MRNRRGQGSDACHVSDPLGGHPSQGFGLPRRRGRDKRVSEAPLSPRAEETTLPVHGAGMVYAEGAFDAVLAGLKSECVLPSCSGEPEGQDPIAEDGRGSVAPNPGEVIGEGEAPRAEDD